MSEINKCIVKSTVKIVKFFFLLFILNLICLNVYSQDGPTVVCQGRTYQYTGPKATTRLKVSWSVTGGTVVSVNGDGSRSITWGYSGGSITLDIQEWEPDTRKWASYSETLYVSVKGPGEISAIYATACQGASITLSNLGGNGINNWQSSPFGQENWVTFTTTTSSSPTVTTTFNQKTKYRVYNSDCNTVSNVIVIDLDSPNNINPGTISGTTTICSGSSPPLFTQNTSSSWQNVRSYQWQKRATSSVWSDISGATDFNYSSPPLVETTYFQRMAKWVCNNSVMVPSNTITVTVIPTSQGGSLSVSSSSVHNNGTVNLDLTRSFGRVLGWYYKYDETAWTQFSTANTTSNSFNVSANGNRNRTYFFYTQVQNEYCPVSNSTTASVFVGSKYDQNINYIVTSSALKRIPAGTTIFNYPVEEVNENFEYFDGLGRPMQTVSTQASPINKQDIVTPITYDDFGRENIKYLPYVSGVADGFYKPAGVAEQAAFYTTPPDKVIGDLRPFSETVFEPSPLNRPAQQFGPGQAWNDSRDPNNRIEKPVSHDYFINTLSEVYLFRYDATTSLINWAGASSPLGFYAAGQLYANKTTDEQGHEVIEFVDKEGRSVCKKVEASGNGSGKVYASTYYIYDDLGNLAVVLPPEGVKELTK